MIRREEGCLVVQVPMVMDNAQALLNAGKRAMQPGAQVFDLSEVTGADSSSIAVMFGWLRHAPLSQSKLTFIHVPSVVRSLADVYHVSQVLPIL